jgi:hypothetical protein
MLIYVSGRYTADDWEERQANIAAARKVAGELWKAGHTALCPHLNSANFEDDFPEIQYEQYIESDLQMVARCDALMMVEGWERSKGANIERNYALSLGIPIYYPHEPMPPVHPTELRCPKQAKRFAELAFGLYRTHLSKNADYGPANTAGPGEIGLGVRLWDKASRCANLSGIDIVVEHSELRWPVMALLSIRDKLKKLGLSIGVKLRLIPARATRHEPFDDSLLDAANYHLMWKLVREGNWGC